MLASILSTVFVSEQIFTHSEFPKRGRFSKAVISHNMT